MDTSFKKTTVRFVVPLLTSSLLLLTALFMPFETHADGVVTDCSSQTDLQEKLKAGGTITFNCTVGSNTIPISGIHIGVDSSLTTDSVIIDGGGVITLQSDGTARVMNVQDGKTLILRNIRLTGGNQDNVGGGIRINGATVMLENVTIDNNIATSRGGGIFVNNSSLTADNSTIENNQASASDGGGMLIINDSVVTVTNSSIMGNQAAGLGGGIAFMPISNAAKLTIEQSEIGNNSAPVAGGGLYLEKGNSTVASVFIDQSVIHGNTVQNGIGGGIQNGRDNFVDTQGVELTLVNSTLSQNVVNGSGAAGQGGGLRTTAGSTELINVTIVGNTATRGGGFDSAGAVLSMRNTLVASNTVTVQSNGRDCHGAPTSAGHNLIGDTGGCNYTAQPTDLVDLSARVGPLQDNGGDTLTHALLSTSPARDAASGATCSSASVSNTDQRGEVRAPNSCDIGAFELPSATLDGVITDCSNKAELEETINNGPNYIIFNCTVGTNTLPITNGFISIIGRQVTIDGGGSITLQGDGSSRLFNVQDGANITFANLTMENGAELGTEPGGAIRVNNAATQIISSTIRNNSAPKGGALFVRNNGELTIINSTLTGNATTDGSGGAVLAEDDSLLTIVDSTIANNRTVGGSGGGVAVSLGFVGSTTARLDGAIIENNESANEGGGLFVGSFGTLAQVDLVNQTIIRSNTATTEGGGIQINGQDDAVITFTVEQSEISNNETTNGNGGGVSFFTIEQSLIEAQIDQSSISNNVARFSGGGIYLDRRGQTGSTAILVTNSGINNNTSTAGDGGGVRARGGGDSLATFDFANVTISGNQTLSTVSPAGDGGGLSLDKNDVGFTSNITNATIVNNSAGRVGGGLRVENAAVVRLHNSILANNTAADSAPDCSPQGILISGGYNLVGDNSLCGSSFANNTNNDIVGVDPQLTPLADNGGGTLTHAVQETSPLLAAGNNGNKTTCESPPVDGIDQRGQPRLICVRGAFEEPAYNLRLTKHVLTSPAAPGELLTFRMVYTISGVSPAPNVVLRDIVPGNSTFSSTTSSEGLTVSEPSVGGTGTVEWTIGSTNNASGFVELNLVVDELLADNTVISNTATLASDDLAINASAQAPVESTVVLTVSKQVTPQEVLPGERLTYTIAYSVAGNSPATDVTLWDDIPANATFISASPVPNSDPGVGQTGPVVWNLGDLITTNPVPLDAPIEGNLTLILQARQQFVAGGKIVNRVSISSTEQPTPHQTTVTSTAIAPDLVIAKQTGTPELFAGQHAEYTFSVRNVGAIEATNVTITDVLPSGFEYLSTTAVEAVLAARTSPFSPTANSQTPTWGSWTILPNGVVTLSFRALVSRDTAPGTYDNQVAVGSDQLLVVADGTASTAEDVVIKALPELLIDKDTTTPQILIGEPAGFTIAVFNNSSITLTGVVITDVLPSGFGFQTLQGIEEIGVTRISMVTPTMGASTSAWGTWSMGPGGRITISYEAVVGDTVTNEEYDTDAFVYSDQTRTLDDLGEVGQDDDTPAGRDPETDEDVQVDRVPELQINKIADTPLVVAGGVATYSIVVRNIGTARATSVIISDTLPAGFTYLRSRFNSISATRVIDRNPAVGEQNPIWRLWVIDSGGMLTVTFGARVATDTAESTFNNWGYARSDPGDLIYDDPTIAGDTDTIPGDTADDDDVIIEYAPLLEVQQTIQPPTVAAGSPLSYTFVVQNRGTRTAQDVDVTAILPQGFIFQGATLEEINAVRSIIRDPSAEENPVEWGSWLLAPGGEVRFTMAVDVPDTVAEGVYSSTVLVESSNTPDVQTRNNVTVLRQPILQVDKKTRIPLAQPGDIVTYTIAVRNIGLFAATNVIITDTLPLGGFVYRQTTNIELQQASRPLINDPTSGATTAVWGGWTIEPGGWLTLTFQVDIFNFAREGTYRNPVSVSSAETIAVTDDDTRGGEPGTIPETDEANDASVSIGDFPILYIDKDTTTPEVSMGAAAGYVIRLENQGTATATGVVITDILPSGFSYLTTTAIAENEATRDDTLNPLPDETEPVWRGWSIAPGGSLSLTFTAQIATDTIFGDYTNSAVASMTGFAVEVRDDGGEARGISVIPGQDTDNDDLVTVVEPTKLAQLYLPLIIKQEPTAPTATHTPTTPVVTVTPDTPTPTATPTTPMVTVTPETPTPTPTTPAVVNAPDLVVERISLTSNLVQVAIKNQGEVAVQPNQEFWVDFYVDPDPPPSQVNDVWGDGRSTQGIAWGVTSELLPLDPGDIIVLSYSTAPDAPNLYASPDFTQFSGGLTADTVIYVHVDSANVNDPLFGGVPETHEIKGEGYNNITSGTLSTLSEPQLNTTSGTSLPQPGSATMLPARP